MHAYKYYSYCDMYLGVYQAVLASIRASEDVMTSNKLSGHSLQLTGLSVLFSCIG